MAVELAAHNLTAQFAAPDGGILPALGPVSFTIAPSEFVCLVGPSGCGKSTLVRVFAGLQPPAQGTVTLDGLPVHEPSPQIGLMFQETNLMPWRTVLDNIALPLELAGVGRQQRYAVVGAMLPMLGLEGFAHAYPGELSGGMAQRAALGRVLAQKPGVLLLDEPFGALDAMTRETVSMDLMRLWLQDRPTVLMVTHDLHEAVLLADRVLVMSRRPGRIIADIAVDLARPRPLAAIYSDAFLHYARRVREAIDRA